MVALSVLAFTSACMRGHAGGASSPPAAVEEPRPSAPPPVAPEAAAAEPPQVQPPPPEEDRQGEAQLERLERYIQAARDGRQVLPARASGCTEVGAAPGCAALHACAVQLRGPSGIAFDETRRMLWIGIDAAVVREAAERTRALTLKDSVPLEGSSWPEVAPSHARLLTLQAVLIGMPGYGGMHGAKRPDPVVIASCRLVDVDACARRIGYVCSGSEVEQQFSPTPESGLYAFETVFGDAPATRVLINPGESIEVE